MPGKTDNTFQYLLIQLLLNGKNISPSRADACDTEKGIYLVCLAYYDKVHILKIGRAFKGKDALGVKRRIKTHMRCLTSNSLLARYLLRDSRLSNNLEIDFKDEHTRRNFVNRYCYFKILTTPSLSDSQLIEFEKYVENNLRYNTRYLKGRILDIQCSTLESMTN